MQVRTINSDGGMVAFVGICAAIELLLLFALRGRVRETTLTAAWWWAVAATVGLTAAEFLAFGWSEPLGRGGAESLRLIAAPLAFCPAMAVLGAKRPQHGAWQFIVLSMWGVLALPGLEHLLLHRGGAVAFHGVRTAFAIGLIAIGVLNWLPTRSWATAICVAAGQAILYGAPWRGGGLAAPAAAFCFVTGTVVLILLHAAPRRDVSGLDRVWLDFRDSFGALWAVRVAERVNAAAVMQGWPLRLRWSGFQNHDSPADAASSNDVSDSLNLALDNVLRRFVSPQWIAKRRGNGVH